MSENKNIVSQNKRTLSVHKEHELLLKLEAAGLDDKLAQKVIDSKGNELAAKMMRLIQGDGSELFATPYHSLIFRQDFWQRHGVDADFTGLVIPAKKTGFDRLLVIPQGLTINKAITLCRKKFDVWAYVDNLDRDVNKNDRIAGKTYAIWVRDRAEADKELKNLSANDLKKIYINGITLLERLVYELKYFDETNQHLDIKYITLCSGSRRSDGCVPGVRWHDGKLDVLWYYSGSADGYLRSRAAVS